jgi:hypothetical protein
MKKINWLAVLVWSVFFIFIITFWILVIIRGVLLQTILVLLCLTFIIIKKEKL